MENLHFLLTITSHISVSLKKKVVNKAMNINLKIHKRMLCTFCNIQQIPIYPINVSTKLTHKL